MDLKKKKLGDILVEANKITKEQLKSALNKQKSKGKKLGEILIDEKIITEENIMEAISQQLGIKKVDINMININKEAIKVIPEKLALKHLLVPIGFKDNKIQVAMWDPLNIFAIDDVKIVSGYDVEPFVATRQEIKRAIERYYIDQYVQEVAQELRRENKKDIKEKEIENIGFDDIKNAPVVKILDSLIQNAIQSRASDIHIEPFDELVKIRYRIDGELQQISTISKDSLVPLVTRIKILANLDIAEKRIPQDGRILKKFNKKEIDLRVSTLPTVFGEKVVIRILNRENYLIGKDKLNMEKEDIEKIEKIIKSPHGIILVTGPTGSGKSTTLYTLLNDLNDSKNNIVTIEDPVEYVLQGVNQVNVNTKAGLTFANGLRSILRQDPDIIMIGEIRDRETAEIAIRAAITGHLVLSTIHTNDSASSIIRLKDMGVMPYLISTSLSGVISQRLVRKICPYCIESHEANEQEKDILDINKNKKLMLYKGQGCGYCKNTGYIGRTGVFEIMEIGREHVEMIMQNKSSDDLQELSIKNGMKTIKMSCRELVLKGQTTLEEFLKIAYLRDF
ncbi:type II secretion system protein GspE [Clostridium niameyense]|uniref:Type II secretion system protein GspE n=1 Tax=Clostridium niameyense TaxID=1622073 RepID=A0A6M0R8I6_9CLOT|nr:GspE/PulE family protein [Clostridium niameyense]NEZ46562.1 type II secretion system protein GspE [Clostridium niameyense]